MPRADMLPSFTTEISEVPSTTHPLGIRPAGEGGTTPALGVVINAIVDALGRVRRGPHRDAGDAGAHLARHPRQAVTVPDGRRTSSNASITDASDAVLRISLAVAHGANGRFKLTFPLDRLVRASLLRVREGEAHD